MSRSPCGFGRRLRGEYDVVAAGVVDTLDQGEFVAEVFKRTGLLALLAVIAVIVLGSVLGIPLALMVLAVLLIGTLAAARSNGPYVLRRVLGLVPVIMIVTFLTYIMVNLLPGDPAVNILGPGATPEGIAELRERLRLDDPVLTRYGRWLGGAVTGDLGVSPFLNEPITDGIGRTLPISLLLMFYAQAIALGLAVPLGVLASYKAGSRLDKTINTTAFGFLSVPNFVVAVLLVLFFALGGVQLFGIDWGFRILPASRYVPFSEDPFLHFKHMLLPSLSLALGSIATYMRLLRSDMIATLQEDFINVAKAKGMSTPRILLGHALRPSSFTLLTVIGINIGALIGGSLIIETIFNLPSMGTYIATAIFQRDYLVIQGAAVVIVVGFVFANFAVDLLYAILDPRIRHARAIL